MSKQSFFSFLQNWARPHEMENLNVMTMQLVTGQGTFETSELEWVLEKLWRKLYMLRMTN